MTRRRAHAAPAHCQLNWAAIREFSLSRPPQTSTHVTRIGGISSRVCSSRKDTLCLPSVGRAPARRGTATSTCLRVRKRCCAVHGPGNPLAQPVQSAVSMPCGGAALGRPRPARLTLQGTPARLQQWRPWQQQHRRCCCRLNRLRHSPPPLLLAPAAEVLQQLMAGGNAGLVQALHVRGACGGRPALPLPPPPPPPQPAAAVGTPLLPLAAAARLAAAPHPLPHSPPALLRRAPLWLTHCCSARWQGWWGSRAGTSRGCPPLCAPALTISRSSTASAPSCTTGTGEPGAVRLRESRGRPDPAAAAPAGAPPARPMRMPRQLLTPRALARRGREERRALEEKYDALYTPLYDKRAAVVNGAAEAPENETGGRVGWVGGRAFV